MKLLAYVSSLSTSDYRDWLCIPSLQTGIHSEYAYIQNFSYIWFCPIALTLYGSLHIEWGDSLTCFFQILIAVNVLTALTLAEIFEEKLIDYLPVCAHFLLWGCSRKYRASRWYPPALPPFVAACASAFFGLPLASIVVTAHYLVRKHKYD